MMESLTPRTDVEAEENGLNRVVSADFARQLERELAEARRDAEMWKGGYESARAFIDSHVADPDITPRMIETYAAFEARRAAIDAAMKVE